jgi:hypothetical protein
LRLTQLRITSGSCICPAAGGVVDLYSGPHEVIDNEIFASTDNGVYTDDVSSSILIHANNIHDNGTVVDANQDHGIYLQGASAVATQNQIRNHPQGFGVQAGDNGSNQQVTYNVIDNSGNGRPCCGGIVHWGSNPGIRIDNNTITNSRNLAIERNTTASCVSVSFNSLGGDGMSSNFPCPTEGNIP